MNNQPEIIWVRSEEIDRSRWDHCIQKSENGRIYAYSWYLDIMADNWDALLLGDYSAVMPLPWRSKWGIAYIYQPFLCAQLGIFGNDLTSDLTNRFIEAIPTRFRLAEISMNPGNREIPHSFVRNNYVLTLNKPYEKLYEQYRENNQRNIKKAIQIGCQVVKTPPIEEIINLARSQMREKNELIENNINSFNDLYRLLKIKDQVVSYGITGPDQQLIASAVFIFDEKRAYYILVGNHPNGRTLGASHALIDAFIKDHANTKWLLDFEGSDIRNLAFFYSGFGAQLEQYPFLKWNRLPLWLKWLKA